MALPVIPLALMGVGGYAVYRAFREHRPHRASANNDWRNEAYSSRKERDEK